ncbi:MAG: DUF4235 domain-containing protein [Trebonia sp.]
MSKKKDGKKDGSSGSMVISVAGIAVPLLLRKVLAIAWAKVAGKDAPIDLTDPKVTLPEALGWAIVLAIVVETARFTINGPARRRSALESAATESD